MPELKRRYPVGAALRQCFGMALPMALTIASSILFGALAIYGPIRLAVRHAIRRKRSKTLLAAAPPVTPEPPAVADAPPECLACTVTEFLDPRRFEGLASFPPIPLAQDPEATPAVYEPPKPTLPDAFESPARCKHVEMPAWLSPPNLKSAANY